MYHDTAQMKELEEHFSQGNGTKIQEIKREKINIYKLRCQHM